MAHLRKGDAVLAKRKDLLDGRLMPACVLDVTGPGDHLWLFFEGM